MKYKYTGPDTGVTLVLNGEEKEIMLYTGKTVDLPENHEYTKTLLALKYLARTPSSASGSNAKKGGA